MRKTLLALLVFSCLPLLAGADEAPKLSLWEMGPPGFEKRKDEKETRHIQKSGEYKVTNVHNPYLTLFLPPADKATGAAVILAPGGGHRELWVLHEGENVARWLSEHGVAAFVLRYRLGREKDTPYKIAEHALQDGQRAMRLVRAHARGWNVNPSRIGMMGFSAGGEVVAMVSNHPDDGKADAPDPIDRQSCRLNFQALVYSGPLGVRDAIITKETPPTFILVGDNDNAANVLVEYYQKLRKSKVSAELHVFANTPHGFGLRPKGVGRPVELWPQRFLEFLKVEGMLDKTTSAPKS